MTYHRLLFISVILMALVLCLYNLGSFAFMDFDEALYARALQNAQIHNDYLSFYVGGDLIDKPPLYFWLMKITSLLFDNFEFAFRLPSTLLTILSIMLVWKITERLTKNTLTSFLASLILLTTSYFIFAGRQLRLDVPVTASVLFAFYFFLKGFKKPIDYIGFALSVGSAVMFKSFVGLMILPIILIYSLVYKNWSWLKNKHFWFSSITAVMIIMPWHLYETLQFGKIFWNSYLFTAASRLSGETYLTAEASIWYHIQQLFIVTNPWLLVFVVTTCFVVFLTLLDSTKKNGQENNDRFIICTILTTLFIIVIFFVPKSRLLYYFIPAFPFMAMAIAGTVVKIFERNKLLLRLTLCPIFIVAFINTSLRIFTPTDRNVFFQQTSKISRYQVSNEEKIVAQHILKNPDLPVYLYRWQFYPTLTYYTNYSNSKPRFIRSNSKTIINFPALILLPKPFYVTQESIKKILPPKSSFKLLYEGNAALLIKISQ